MSGIDAKNEWVRRVLGVTPSAATAATVGGGIDNAGKFSIVQLGRARIRWADVRQRAVDGIAELKAEIAEEFADFPAQQKQLAQALATLDKKVGELVPTLEEQLDRVLDARTPDERSKLANVARATLQGFIRYVDDDPIIAALDGNEVLPSMKVAAPMRGALSQIANALG